MTPMRLLGAYIEWHFGTGFRELYEFWKNVSWFGYHFFSIPLLLKTLIRPLYRIHESAAPGTGINLELFFENIAVNFAARVIGFFLRVFLILCGGIYQLVVLILGPVLFLLWFFLPAIPVVFLFLGIRMLVYPFINF